MGSRLLLRSAVVRTGTGLWVGRRVTAGSRLGQAGPGGRSRAQCGYRLTTHG